MKKLFLKTVPLMLALGIVLSGCAKSTNPKDSNKASPTSTTKASTAAVSTQKPSASATATVTPSTSPSTTGTAGDIDGYKNFKASNDEDPVAGGLFVGTFSTAVEYKDITITRDGKTYAIDDFKDSAKSAVKWTEGLGTWSATGGLLTQTDTTVQDCRYVLNDFYADNYTLELKGKKTDGLEGFYIGLGMKDEAIFYRVVLGGWQNTKSVLDINAGAAFEERTDLLIDSDVWYNIKVVVGTDKIECYINGVLSLSANGIT